MTTVEHTSLITPDRLRNLVRAAERTVHLPGDMAELGVYKGGSARIIAEVAPQKIIHLFDTFKGLPQSEEPGRDPDGLLGKGEFACKPEVVVAYMRGYRALVYPGVFPKSAPSSAFTFSFVHVDCDLYDGAKAAIEWFYPRLVPGGIIYFDDYGCTFTGVTDAVNEAFPPERIELQYDVHGFQIGALVVKL